MHEPTSHAAADPGGAAIADGIHRRRHGTTPTFALPRAEFDEWAGDRETFRMEEFYRTQRRRFGADGRRRAGRRALELRPGEPGAAAEGRPAARSARSVAATEDEIDAEVRADLDALGLPRASGATGRAVRRHRHRGLAALAHFVEQRLPDSAHPRTRS